MSSNTIKARFAGSTGKQFGKQEKLTKYSNDGSNAGTGGDGGGSNDGESNVTHNHAFDQDGWPSSYPKAVLISKGDQPFLDRNLNLIEPVKIGRAVGRFKPSHANAIFDCKVLSRNHALLYYENNKFYLQDTGSSNGTFVNSLRLGQSNEQSAAKEVFSGDYVQFGVDVLDNTKQVTIACIAATLKLYHPDGTEALPTDQVLTLGGKGLISSNVMCVNLLTLTGYLKEACQREEVLRNKLMTLSTILEKAQTSSEQSWKAMVEEDMLLIRIESLQCKLQSLLESDLKNPDEAVASLRKELVTLQEDRERYEAMAKETIQKVLQEKLMIIAKNNELEVALSTSEEQKNHYKACCDELVNEMRKFAEEHDKQFLELQEMQNKCKELERKLDAVSNSTKPEQIKEDGPTNNEDEESDPKTNQPKIYQSIVELWSQIEATRNNDTNEEKTNSPSAISEITNNLENDGSDVTNIQDQASPTSHKDDSISQTRDAIRFINHIMADELSEKSFIQNNLSSVDDIGIEGQSMEERKQDTTTELNSSSNLPHQNFIHDPDSDEKSDDDFPSNNFPPEETYLPTDSVNTSLNETLLSNSHDETLTPKESECKLHEDENLWEECGRDEFMVSPTNSSDVKSQTESSLDIICPENTKQIEWMDVIKRDGISVSSDEFLIQAEKIKDLERQLDAIRSEHQSCHISWEEATNACEQWKREYDKVFQANKACGETFKFFTEKENKFKEDIAQLRTKYEHALVEISQLKALLKEYKNNNLVTPLLSETAMAPIDENSENLSGTIQQAQIKSDDCTKETFSTDSPNTLDQISASETEEYADRNLRLDCNDFSTEKQDDGSGKLENYETELIELRMLQEKFEEDNNRLRNELSILREEYELVSYQNRTASICAIVPLLILSLAIIFAYYPSFSSLTGTMGS